jgi:hypothetical protein
MPWKSITEQIRVLDDELWLPGRVVFPIRATAIRLEDGTVWLHSPTRMDDEDAAALAAWGEVRHLVAPNALHHLYLGAAAERFPEARVWGPVTLPKKRPDLRFDGLLGQDVAPWEGEIGRIAIEGAPWVDEHVFFHHRSGTLLVTDLLFHVVEPKTIATSVVHMIVGTWKRLGQSRVWRWQTEDKGAAAAACRRVLAWPIERVVPAHGAVVEEQAKERLREALGWMVG